MSRPPTGAPVRPPAMPARTAPVLPLHPDRAPQEPPTAREDRRAVARAARARRRAVAEERRGRGATGHHPRLVLGGAVAVLVLLVGLPLLLAFGPVFPVRTIRVSGADAALSASVRTALQGQLGRPVAVVDDHDVASALAAVPAVERFTLVRRPPSTLEVAIVPRTAILQQRTGSGWASLDAARVTIETDGSPSGVLPVLTIPTGTKDAAAAYASAASALAALAGAEPPVTAVRAASADDVRLTLRGGLVVQWGGAEGGAAKAEALHAALRTAARGASEIDVSSPGVVLTR